MMMMMMMMMRVGSGVYATEAGRIWDGKRGREWRKREMNVDGWMHFDGLKVKQAPWGATKEGGEREAKPIVLSIPRAVELLGASGQ